MKKWTLVLITVLLAVMTTTAMAQYGSGIHSVYNNENGFSVDLTGLPQGLQADTRIEVYSGNKLLTTVTPKVDTYYGAGTSGKWITVSVRSSGESSAWKQTPWQGTEDDIPTRLVLHDGNRLIDEYLMEETPYFDWNAMPKDNLLKATPAVSAPAYSAPKTGDSSSLMLWAGLMIVAAMGMVMISRKHLSADR